MFHSEEIFQGFNKIWLDKPIDWSEDSVVAMYNNWIEHVKKTVPSGNVFQFKPRHESRQRP